MMPNMLERKLHLPTGMTPRLVEEIEAYSAFVELQNKMGATQPWFQRLA